MSIIKEIKAALPDLKEEELRVFEHFLNITKVPRGSKHHGPIEKYLGEVADSFGFTHVIDEYNNLLITIPASKGCEDIPAVCIQAHSDMVCVAAHDFDFKTQPIEVRIKDFYEDGNKWLMGTNTTLGGDNGVGIAYCFALCDEIKRGTLKAYPKIYILITSDEEIGLVGASDMLKKPEFFPKDIGYLINADSEDFGHICISSCGGARHDITYKNLKVEEFNDFRTFKLDIDGCTSGHSGADIQLMRANALKLAGRVIETLLQECEECARPSFHLVNINAGTTHNAIPYHAVFEFGFTGFKDECCAWVIDTVKKAIEDCKTCYVESDPKMVGTIVETKLAVKKGLSNEDSMKILNLINLIPAGVIRMSRAVDGLVESSYNPAVATLKLEDAEFHLMGSGRSCIEPELDQIYRTLKNICRICGATTIEQSSRYPGWPANPNSKLLTLIKKNYEKYCDNVIVEAIHAGLEVGMLVSGRNIEAVSIGPTILSPHSTVERMKLDTVVPAYNILKETVIDIANRK